MLRGCGRLYFAAFYQQQNAETDADREYYGEKYGYLFKNTIGY